MHPLASDLSGMKDSEVEAKLNELTKKYFQATRLGNPDLLTQLSMFVNIYREEMSNRYRNSLKSTNIDGDLDQLINVD